MLLASLLVASAWADCPTPTTVQALQTSIGAAEQAYAQLDLEGFERAVEQSRATVACLGEVAPPSTVAALHRIEGLSAFVASSTDRSQRAFAAARRVDPAYRFPEDLVPAGNPVLQAYTAIDPKTVPTVDAPAPSSGSLRIDGQPTRERPTELPTVVQWVEPQGTVGASAYVWPGDPLPPYPVPTAKSGSSSSRKLALGVTAGGAGLVTAGLFAWNLSVHQRYEDPTTPDSRLDALRHRNNTLVVASALTLTITLGSGVGAVVVP